MHKCFRCLGLEYSENSKGENPIVIVTGLKTLKKSWKDMRRMKYEDSILECGLVQKWKTFKIWEHVETDSSNTICKKITNVIVKFLDEDSVNMVCLQEVPYKCNYSCRANHLLYNETFNSFKSYSTFVANKSCKWAYARTMVISQDAWKNSDDEYSGDKSNHVIQIKKDQVKIMALHMPPIQMPKKDDKEVEDVEGSSVNRKLWENIIDQCKKSKPQIVLGILIQTILELNSSANFKN